MTKGPSSKSPSSTSPSLNEELRASSLEQRLVTETFGKPLIVENNLVSTNQTLLEMGEQGAPHGTVVIADSQSGGRGRRKRRWHSPPRSNLYLSLLLRPPLPPHKASPLTLAAAVAAAETVFSTIGTRPTLKWPNDLLLDGKKLAGILTEMRATAEKIHFIVLGLGINVNGQDFPCELSFTATSLALHTGATHCRAELAAKLLFQLERYYTLFLKEGAKPILDAWKSWPNMLGQPVIIKPPGPKEELHGIAVDLDSDGALLLERPGKKVKRVLSGDLVSTLSNIA